MEEMEEVVEPMNTLKPMEAVPWSVRRARSGTVPVSQEARAYVKEDTSAT